MLAEYSLKLPKAVYAGEDAVDKLTAILQSEKAERVVLFTDKGIEAVGLCSLVTERITKAGASFSIINDTQKHLRTLPVSTKRPSMLI